MVSGGGYNMILIGQMLVCIKPLHAGCILRYSKVSESIFR
jgi:hypothetical protein